MKKIEQEKPHEREIEEFYTGAAQEHEEITILDLSEKDVSRYELWLRIHTRKEAQWSKKEKALREFNHEISRTIASRHIHLISDCSTPYDRLKALKKHLCPSTSERNYQLRAHYQGLLTPPKRSAVMLPVENNLPIRELVSPSFREMIQLANPAAADALWVSHNSVSAFAMKLFSALQPRVVAAIAGACSKIHISFDGF